MAGSILSLDAAYAQLCADLADDDTPVSQRVWPTLQSLCAFPQGDALLRERANFVQDSTTAGSAYHIAWRAGITQCLKVMPAQPTWWDFTAGIPGEHPDRLIRLRRVSRHQELSREVAKVCELVHLVMGDYWAHEGLRKSLHDWWMVGQSIVAQGTTYHADLCRRMYWAWTEGHLGFGIALLDTSLAPETLAESRITFSNLIAELKHRIANPSTSPTVAAPIQGIKPTPVYGPDDDLMTIDELAQLVPTKRKTLWNKNVIGPAAVPGGGRNNKSKWHYRQVRDAIGKAFSCSMPSLEEALQNRLPK